MMNEATVVAELAAISSAPEERDHRAMLVAATIRRFCGYRWVGIYDVSADEIAVLCWDWRAACAPAIRAERRAFWRRQLLGD